MASLSSVIGEFTRFYGKEIKAKGLTDDAISAALENWWLNAGDVNIFAFGPYPDDIARRAKAMGVLQDAESSPNDKPSWE